MTTQTHSGEFAGAFPEFGPGDRVRLVRRKMLGITPAVALRLEMLTAEPGTAAFILGVLPVTPKGGPGLPRMDSNHQPPGLRYVGLATVAA